MKIITRHEPPPIPMRQFDWSASYETSDESDPVGRGETEAKAIADLLAEHPPKLNLWFAEDAWQNSCIFWKNPYTGESEVIANFLWPKHPPQKTTEVELLFEHIAKVWCEIFAEPQRESEIAP